MFYCLNQNFKIYIKYTEKYLRINFNIIKMLRGTKVVFVGQSNVGKTSILHRFNNDFSPDSRATVGVAFMKKTVKLHGKDVVLEIWDTAGQERYNSMTKTYFRGAGCCVFVFDMTDIQSLHSLNKWKQMADETLSSHIHIKYIVVGNKNDLDQPKIDQSIIEKWCTVNTVSRFIVTSAVTGEGINELIIQIATCISNNKQHNDEDIIKLHRVQIEKSNSNCRC